MAIEHKLIRIDYPGDPERCEAVHANQQCPYKRAQGSKYCMRHGGNNGQNSLNELAVRNYKLAKYQARINDFADNPKVKDLREEVGIVRMTLETVLSKCNDDNEILMASGKIADLVTRIEKLVVSCHKLETSTGMLLDRATAINIAMQIVEIIGRYIDDSSILNKIGTEIATVIVEAGK